MGGDGTLGKIVELEYDEALIVEFGDTEEFDNRDAIGLLWIWWELGIESVVCKASDWVWLDGDNEDETEAFPPLATDVTTIVGCFLFSCSASRSFDRKPFLVHKRHEYVFPTFLFLHVTWNR